MSRIPGRAPLRGTGTTPVVIAAKPDSKTVVQPVVQSSKITKTQDKEISTKVVSKAIEEKTTTEVKTPQLQARFRDQPQEQDDETLKDSSSKSHDECFTDGDQDECSKVVSRNVTLQLFDGYGIPVPDTQFTITVELYKQGRQVTLEVPPIGFQTGPDSGYGGTLPSNAPYPPIPPTPANGYLDTVAGWLPEKYRPQVLVDQAFPAASDDGVLKPFSFNPDGTHTSPKTISGFILRIGINGNIRIQGAGVFGNGIPAGNHQLLGTSAVYLARRIKHLTRNVKISDGRSTHWNSRFRRL